MARLEKLRAEWKRFEREDKPAFERWMAATFGPLLSELREQESLLREKEALVHEVEEEMFFVGARSYRAAYAAVMRRRTAPPAAAESDAGEPPLDEPEEDDSGIPFSRGMPDFEQHLLFEEFVRTFMGINPDRLSDERYDGMFEDFQENFLGRRGAQPPRRERPPEPAKPERARIKEIYRLLVRRLHPDTRADKDAETSALWHEVQEAYGHGNLERLEMLLAFTDIRSNAAGDHTSLSQMRSVLRELRRSFNALKRSLGSARREPAWNFVRSPDRAALRVRLKRQLESDLAAQKEKLRKIEGLISTWSAPPKARKQKVAAVPKAREQRVAAHQAEFGF